MFTKEQILTQLNNLNVPNGKPVIVHTSLRAVGEIQGGAQTLLDALIERFTAYGGLLIIPTHTWANFEDKKEIVLDYTSDQTCTGVLSNVALSDKRGYRSYNPTHSVMVFGDKAKEFARLDDNVLTPCSPKGCHGKIINDGGYVLLIGIGQEKNTLLHCVEEILDMPNRISNLPVKMMIKKSDGSLTSREFHYLTEKIGDTSLYFPKYESAFRYHNGITDGIIGNAKVQVCSALIMKKVASLIYERCEKAELFANDEPINPKFYK